MLRDISIENYRLFDEFTLDGMARVNLVVGTNNCGKTSLLEAIYLLVAEDAREAEPRLLEILRNRGEATFAPSGWLDSCQVTHIFRAHRLKAEQRIRARSKLDEPLSLDVHLHKRSSKKDPGDRRYPLALTMAHKPKKRKPSERSMGVAEDGTVDEGFRIEPREQSARLIATGHQGYDELAELWDSILLTPHEGQVVQALQILEPAVERIAFTTTRERRSSSILVKLAGTPNPIPLGSLGDGMRRVLAVAAALASVEGGTLLVDEIDTGLYYGVLTGVWRVVLETAARLDAQVFATTHSWDCVRSFQEALSSASDPDLGRLIRLEREGEAIGAVSYAKDELEIAIQQGIEVR